MHVNCESEMHFIETEHYSSVWRREDRAGQRRGAHGGGLEFHGFRIVRKHFLR